MSVSGRERVWELSFSDRRGEISGAMICEGRRERKVERDLPWLEVKTSLKYEEWNMASCLWTVKVWASGPILKWMNTGGLLFLC